MGGHHLVLGETVDYLTGETREDTLDERYRQEIARLLVEEKGFRREDLTSRVPIDIDLGDKQARVRLDLIVHFDERIVLLIKYAPGSLTTRHQVATCRIEALGALSDPFQCGYEW